MARLEAEGGLRDRLTAAAQAEAAARAATKAREGREDGLPSRREEEAIASAILQRLSVQRDGLTEQEARARQMIDTLRDVPARW